MKCIVCNKEFEPKHYKTICCSDICKKDRNSQLRIEYRNTHKEANYLYGKKWCSKNEQKRIASRKIYKKENRVKCNQQTRKYEKKANNLKVELSKIHNIHYSSWNYDDIIELVNLKESGMIWVDIAEKLKRSISSVKNKYRRFNKEDEDI